MIEQALDIFQHHRVDIYVKDAADHKVSLRAVVPDSPADDTLKCMPYGTYLHQVRLIVYDDCESAFEIIDEAGYITMTL